MKKTERKNFGGRKNKRERSFFCFPFDYKNTAPLFLSRCASLSQNIPSLGLSLTLQRSLNAKSNKKNKSCVLKKKGRKKERDLPPPPLYLFAGAPLSSNGFPFALGLSPPLRLLGLGSLPPPMIPLAEAGEEEEEEDAGEKAAEVVAA